MNLKETIEKFLFEQGFEKDLLYKTLSVLDYKHVKASLYISIWAPSATDTIIQIRGHNDHLPDTFLIRQYGIVQKDIIEAFKDRIIQLIKDNTQNERTN